MAEENKLVIKRYEVRFKCSVGIYISEDDLEVGDYVAVQCGKGYNVGAVSQLIPPESYTNNTTTTNNNNNNNNENNSAPTTTTSTKEVKIQKILNKLTEDKAAIEQMLKNKVLAENNALALCRTFCHGHRIGTFIDAIAAEFQFDRKKLTIYVMKTGDASVCKLVRKLFDSFKMRISILDIASVETARQLAIQYLELTKLSLTLDDVFIDPVEFLQSLQNNNNNSKGGNSQNKRSGYQKSQYGYGNASPSLLSALQEYMPSNNTGPYAASTTSFLPSQPSSSSSSLTLSSYSSPLLSGSSTVSTTTIPISHYDPYDSHQQHHNHPHNQLHQHQHQNQNQYYSHQVPPALPPPSHIHQHHHHQQQQQSPQSHPQQLHHHHNYNYNHGHNQSQLPPYNSYYQTHARPPAHSSLPLSSPSSSSSSSSSSNNTNTTTTTTSTIPIPSPPTPLSSNSILSSSSSSLLPSSSIPPINPPGLVDRYEQRFSERVYHPQQQPHPYGYDASRSVSASSFVPPYRTNMNNNIINTSSNTSTINTTIPSSSRENEYYPHKSQFQQQSSQQQLPQQHQQQHQQLLSSQHVYQSQSHFDEYRSRDDSRYNPSKGIPSDQYTPRETYSDPYFDVSLSESDYHSDFNKASEDMEQFDKSFDHTFRQLMISSRAPIVDGSILNNPSITSTSNNNNGNNGNITNNTNNNITNNTNSNNNNNNINTLSSVASNQLSQSHQHQSINSHYSQYLSRYSDYNEQNPSGTMTSSLPDYNLNL